MTRKLDRDSHVIDEGIRRRYEQAWHSGLSPALEDFLPDHDSPARLGTLIELVCIEIEEMWKRCNAGNGQEPNSIDDYLQRFPELKAAQTTKQLIEQEWLMRNGEGHSVDLNEYARRFPDACALLDTLAKGASEPVISRHRSGQLEVYASIPGSLGNYELLECVGEGGMGWVWRARHKRLGSAAAVKVLKNTDGEAVDVRLRFEREGRAAANLRHPHIAAAFDAGDEEPWSYIVFEFVEGENLRQIVERDGPFQESVAIRHVRQAAVGLAHAHNCGFVHRDVKPANLMVDCDGQIKLLDLGLASARANSEWSDVTTIDVLMGTVDYMAPEQGLDPRLADARADVYSLGCTLFYLLTGKTIFSGDTRMARLVAHREEPIPSLQEYRPQVSLKLQHVFAKLVAKRPEDRYANMGEVIAALDSIEESQSPTPGASPLIRIKVVLVLVACAAVLLLAIVLKQNLDETQFVKKTDKNGAIQKARALMESVDRQRALEILQIGASFDASIDGRPWAVVSANEIPDEPFQIVSMSLGGDEISDDAVVGVLPLPGLRYLSLQGCRLTTRGLDQIVRLAPELESLHFGAVDLADVDLSSLRELRQLRTLWIGRTGIDDGALEVFGQIESLGYLWVGETSTTDNGVRHLSGLSNLKGLGLEYTQVTGDCLQFLDELQLGTLVLDGVAISDDDIDQLAKMKTLHGLSLHGTEITDAGLARLRALLPKCEVSR